LPSDLVIYGAGGMGQEVADLVGFGSAIGGASRTATRTSWHLIGFLDDDRARHGQEVLGVPVLGGREWLSGRSVAVVVAIGAPAARRHAWHLVRSMGVTEAPALIHDAAYVGRGCQVGQGTIVAAHATLTADVTVGSFAIVNAGATVSHNARMADFATVAPGAHLAGNVVVGEGADIGIGSSVVQGRTVGEWSIVGAGAVVITDVPPDTTVVGCPARVIATRAAGWQQ
jgi:sugar O-acyltransferase (sialic acid O-acetyltransferase NeuD family)